MKHTTEIAWLHDNHSHVSLYASLALCPDLSSLDAPAARSVLETCQPDRLSLVTGWKSNELELSKDYLAELPPVLIVNRSLHGFLVSRRALTHIEDLLPGFSRLAGDKRWMEGNVPRLFALYGSISGLDDRKLSVFMTSMEALGFGSLEDMTLTTLEAHRLIATSSLSPRIAAWAGRGLASEIGPNDHRLSGVKFFLDGSLGARTAALSGGFIGTWESILCYDDESLLKAARSCLPFSGLSFHAIGDLAIEQAIRIIKKLRTENHAGIIRIEHAQFIDANQARMCKDARVILSMQPNFSGDSLDYRDRLSETLQFRNNPFRMLIDDSGFIPGEDLVFGSDGMPHGIAWPLRTSLFSPIESQRLSMDELCRGYGPARGVSGTAFLEIDDTAQAVRVLASKKAE